MAGSTELPEQQRLALGRLKPLVDELRLYLAGGTAIALHLHHRVSRDLDLFSRDARLDLERARSLIVELPEAEIIALTEVALMARLSGVPIDIVKYPYALLASTEDGPAQIPIASLEDLATMKLSAASRRGIRRDFWDLFEIFQSGALTLSAALDRYVLRFSVKEADVYHVLRALTYFDDANADAVFPEGLTPEKWRGIQAWFVTNAAAVLKARVGA